MYIYIHIYIPPATRAPTTPTPPPMRDTPANRECGPFLATAPARVAAVCTAPNTCSFTCCSTTPALNSKRRCEKAALDASRRATPAPCTSSASSSRAISASM